MLNYKKSGDVITLTAPRALVSGDGMIVGSFFGVATHDAAINTPVEAYIKGVIELPKATPLVISQGDPVYWDNTAFNINKTASNTLVGVCETAAASSATVVRVRLNSGYYPALDASVQQSVDVTITTAQVKALFGTPITVVAAPGAGLAVVPIGAVLFLDFGTVAYDGIAAGENFVFKYTNAAGATLITVESDGFLDASADALRYVDAANTLITPVANTPIVAHILSGEIATGDSPLKIRFFYRVVPTTL